MRWLNLFLLAAGLLAAGVPLSSCSKNSDASVAWCQAVVDGRNMDCGIWQIQIDSGFNQVKALLNSSANGIQVWQPTLIALNLPDSLKMPGIRIILEIRRLKPEESGICTDMGPSYPWLYVISAHSIPIGH